MPEERRLKKRLRAAGWLLAGAQTGTRPAEGKYANSLKQKEEWYSEQLLAC